MGGVVGFDLPAVLTMGEALGYDRTAMAKLVPFGEEGMVAAYAKRAAEGGGHDDASD